MLIVLSVTPPLCNEVEVHFMHKGNRCQSVNPS